MKKTSLIILAALFGQGVFAQDIRPIIVGVPFLTINGDARSAGMGDMGVGTSTDAYSQQHNPAKYAFAKNSQAFSMSYTPYMAKLASGMSLGQLTYYNRYSERSAVGASLRYFGMGDINMIQHYGDQPIQRKPNEFSVDLSYSLKLSDRFAMAIVGRFINSNLKYPEADGGNSNASTLAVDVSGFYESDIIAFSGFDGRWRAGFNVQNLGPKIEYDDQPNGSFIPTSLKLGGGFDFILDPYSTVTVTGEVGKLLVPTPPSDRLDNEAYLKYNDIGWFKGVFKSFGDAPGGFSEEMKEVMWSLGAEYWYDNRFAFRTGYFHESKEKGARQFATLGAGVKYNLVTVDLSYLFSTSSVNNPLENILRISLTFDLGRKTYQ